MTSISENTKRLIDFLSQSGVEFRVLEHGECRSSAESSEARSSAGAAVVGAKALVIKMEKGEFSTVVLPGTHRIDNKALKAKIGGFRFANEAEMADATGGLPRGTIPPFGPVLFSGISGLFVDDGLRSFDTIGFNASCLNQSVIISSADYFSICQATDVFRFASLPVA